MHDNEMPFTQKYRRDFVNVFALVTKKKKKHTSKQDYFKNS